MLRISLLALLSISVVGCSKKDDGSAAAGSGSGSAIAGSGSGSAAAAGSGSGSAATAGSGSGSAAAGSGSAMAGSGSDAGSGAGSGSAGAGAGSGSAAGAGSGSAAANDFNFDKLDHKARVEFMKTKVMPAMKTAFQDFDAKKFGKFNCKTCHGKNAEKNKFKMPNADIPKLDFAALKAGKQAPKMAEFMGKTVEPQMAQLLNMPVYNPEKPDPSQFGCLGCHVQKK